MISLKPWSELLIERRKLASEAMNASIAIRLKVGADLLRPICVYGLTESLGVTVRFTAIDMEGVYDRVPKPRIHLSALRPLARRNFNCAHELGHHVFGHGSTVDELRDELDLSDKPDEFLANAFAAFLMMPTLGMRNALNLRKLDESTLTPMVVYAIACNFGVGYATLITHLTYGLGAMHESKAAQLLRANPKALRAELLGDFSSEHLVWVDQYWSAPTIDAEVDSHVLLPQSTRIVGPPLEFIRLTPLGHLYRAVAPGLTRAESKDEKWAAFIRIAKKAYVGLARYRHLEESNE